MFDEEIEKAVLFFIIMENQELDITEEDFINARNKRIAKAIISLKQNKEEISLLTVQNKINAPNQSETLEYLADLGKNIYGADANVLLKKLKDLTKKRKILDLAMQVQKEINDVENVDSFIDTQIQTLGKINMLDGVDEDNFVQQVVEATVNLEKQISKEKDYSLYTGIFKLDEIISGLHNEELTVIGARPRSRKINTRITNSIQYCQERETSLYY